MAMVDLVDRDGFIIGRDTMNIETEETIRNGYVMQIRDGEGAVRIFPVSLDNPPMLPIEIPPSTEIAEIYDVGLII